MNGPDDIIEMQDDRQPNTPKAEQSCLLSCNNGAGDCSVLGFTEPQIIEERKLHENNISALIEMSRTLKKIHVRLLMEGYIITDEGIDKP